MDSRTSAEAVPVQWRMLMKGSDILSIPDTLFLADDDVEAIELWPCGYDAPCQVRNCRAKAATIADSGGRPHSGSMRLCAAHAESLATRERTNGRQIVTRGWGGKTKVGSIP